MESDSRFHHLCRSVQFALDRPLDPSRAPSRGTHELLGRVRSHGLRVSETATPGLYAAARRVSETLELSEVLEVYVVNDPTANAYAPVLASDAQPFVIINSGLAELLGATEMEFAIGHELGHLGCQHGVDEDDERSDRSEFEALQRRSRSRYAEISADRIGLLASRSVFTAARVMVKMASGLSDKSLVLDIDAFLSQLDRSSESVGGDWELEQSHPGLPMRLSAVMQFSRTREYARISGGGQDGQPLQAVDEALAAEFAAVGDGRLDRMEQEFIHLALAWVGLALVMDDSVIEGNEGRALRELVGAEHAESAMAYARAQGRDAVLGKLEEAVHRIRGSQEVLLNRFRRSVLSFCLQLGMQWQKTAAGPILGTIMHERPE